MTSDDTRQILTYYAPLVELDYGGTTAGLAQTLIAIALGRIVLTHGVV